MILLSGKRSSGCWSCKLASDFFYYYCRLRNIQNCVISGSLFLCIRVVICPLGADLKIESMTFLPLFSYVTLDKFLNYSELQDLIDYCSTLGGLM